MLRKTDESCYRISVYHGFVSADRSDRWCGDVRGVSCEGACARACVFFVVDSGALIPYACVVFSVQPEARRPHIGVLLPLLYIVVFLGCVFVCMCMLGEFTPVCACFLDPCLFCRKEATRDMRDA